MLIDLLPKPRPVTMCQWNGTNTDEVATYVAGLRGSYGSAEFIADSTEIGRIVFTYSYQAVPDKTVYAGDWIQGTNDHYGPYATVYTSTEVNARYYVYPDFALPVDDPPNLGGVL